MALTDQAVGSAQADPLGADSPLIRDVGAWLVQFVRTLKTCRLYNANNPTVVRFREELSLALRAVLDRHGELTLETSSRELACGGVPVYVAQSRDDNLAGILHRDGVQRLTFHVSTSADELDFLIDQILHVTGPSSGDDDLVTLLWEADLPGIAIQAAPVEADVDEGGEEEPGVASPMPWPQPQGDAAPGRESATTAASAAGDSEDESRSDDWQILAEFGDLEGAFDELETGAIVEMARLQQEYEAELGQPIVARANDAMASCLATETTPNDREELKQFIPRILREALAIGDWSAVRTALDMLRSCDPDWTAVELFAGLTVGDGPSAITRRAVSALDRQDEAGVNAFLALATEFGDVSAEWLMHVLVESQHKRTRRPLARTIAALFRSRPDRLLPWLADDRWYVVRNAVHILGWIGSDEIVPHLLTAIDHPDVRVRREIVAALSASSAESARPVLLDLLSRAETSLFAAILHQLSMSEDPVVAQRLIEILRDKGFADRSEEAKRAVFMALASQGDAVLVPLEEELTRGGIFSSGLDPHRQSVARSIARIGTPAAKAILDRLTRSAKPGVRKACELALASLGGGDE